jgi:hypothetical protein
MKKAPATEVNKRPAQAHITKAHPLSPRQRRLLSALLAGPVTTAEARTIAGASNAPACVSTLRGRGLSIQTRMAPGTDRDGKPCEIGTYYLDEESRAHAHQLLTLFSEEAAQ